jgi:catechol 2,3-dioxygenase-like lactoylglutathione lyase family enzyme
LRASAGLPKNFKASMLQSLQKGSKTEIDYINGAVIHAARRHGIATPVNQTLVACIKGIERALELGSVSTAPNAASPETGASSYLEHVALRVADIQWHLRFFKEVLGQDLREVDGPADRPRQVWTLGGLQFMDTPNFKPKPSNDEGWLAHLGIMVNDLDKALRDAHQWDVSVLPQGPNWLQLPDGLAVELIQAAPGAVKAALSVQPR